MHNMVGDLLALIGNAFAWLFGGVIGTALLWELWFKEPTLRWLVMLARQIIEKFDNAEPLQTLPIANARPPPIVAWDRLSTIIGQAQAAQTREELVDRAGALTDVRDVIRAQISAAFDVYNSDLDEIANILRRLNGRRPGSTTERKLRLCLARLAKRWPAKLDELNRIRARLAAEWDLAIK